MIASHRRRQADVITKVIQDIIEFRDVFDSITELRSVSQTVSKVAIERMLHLHSNTNKAAWDQITRYATYRLFPKQEDKLQRLFWMAWFEREWEELHDSSSLRV